MSTKEYISIVCVDPINNKWRSYALQVSANKVVCLWGRMNKYKRALTKNFETTETRDKFIRSILLRRKRNGYKILDKSEGFPNLDIISDMPTTDNIAGQLRLF